MKTHVITLSKTFPSHPNTRTATKSENLIIVTGEVGERSYVADIIPDTLGQFTGLHDKQGNEIYQGDILRWATLVGAVTWHPYGYWCIHTDDDDISNHMYITIGEAIKIAKNENYDFEVIGNIHDPKPRKADIRPTDSGKEYYTPQGRPEASSSATGEREKDTEDGTPSVKLAEPERCKNGSARDGKVQVSGAQRKAFSPSI